MRLIRKQKNRRLYDTVDKRNVTLQEVAEIIGSGESVKVEDGATGADLTRSVLLQIVIEQESPGAALLSQSFLESLIRLYNNPLNLLASGYLDASMAAFERRKTELAQGWQAAGSAGNAASGLAEAAQEGLRSWMSLQRSLLDAWTGRTPEPNEKPED